MPVAAASSSAPIVACPSLPISVTMLPGSGIGHVGAIDERHVHADAADDAAALADDQHVTALAGVAR